MATKPYAGKSLVRLVEMVNQDNPDKVIVLGTDFSAGAPRPEDGPEGRNTKVKLSPLPGTRWKGPQDISYTRLNIDVLSRLPDGFVKDVPAQPLPFSIHGSLAWINSALGLDLDKEEVADETFTTLQERYPLTLNGNVSYAWLSSSYLFKMAPLVDEIDLAVVIADGKLNGLEYIQP